MCDCLESRTAVMCVDFMQRQQTVNTKTRCEKEKHRPFYKTENEVKQWANAS